MLLSAMGAQFLWVLLGSVWMDSSITAWRRGTGAFIHWLSHHWLRVAPRVARFPALPSCAAAQTDEALQGFCCVWVIQKTHLCVAQAGSNMPGSVLAEIGSKASKCVPICVQYCTHHSVLHFYPPLERNHPEDRLCDHWVLS